MNTFCIERHIKTNGHYFDKWILQFVSGLTTIEIPERQVNFAHVESLKIGQKLKVEKVQPHGVDLYILFQETGLVSLCIFLK